MMQEPKLKPQLKMLVVAYCGKDEGNAVQAAVTAGYSKTYAKSSAYKLLARKDVKEYIEYINSKMELEKRIMELEDIQAFWSDVIENKFQEMKFRLRASELLAKSKGAFLSEY